MEFLQRQTLKHLITDQPLELERVLEIATQVADALDAAHAERIVHRGSNKKKRTANRRPLNIKQAIKYFNYSARLYPD
jgi:serine/threonine protein kinase